MCSCALRIFSSEGADEVYTVLHTSSDYHSIACSYRSGDELLHFPEVEPKIFVFASNR
jgi:hypothetical protein